MEFVRRPITEKGRTIAISMGHTEYLGQKRGERGGERPDPPVIWIIELCPISSSIYPSRHFSIRSLAEHHHPMSKLPEYIGGSTELLSANFFKGILYFGVKKHIKI